MTTRRVGSDGQDSTNIFDFLFSSPSAAVPEMCAAEDIFHRGKLLPFGTPPPPSPKNCGTQIPAIAGVHARPSPITGGSPNRSRRMQDIKSKKAAAVSGPWKLLRSLSCRAFEGALVVA